MEYLLAPMDGFTDFKYRQAHYHVFGSLSKGVSPFVSLAAGKKVKLSHLRDLWPEHNLNMQIEPQILGNEEDYFAPMAIALQSMGYKQLNWNLGCPMSAIARKQRGSGLLMYPDRIDRFLEKAFNSSSISISVKIRLGYQDKKEFWEVSRVLNRYPLAYVAVHPRTGLQVYGGLPDLNFLEEALPALDHPCIYSGNVFTVKDAQVLQLRFPTIQSCMLGRGVLYNPCLPSLLMGQVFSQTEEEMLCLKYLEAVYQNQWDTNTKEKAVVQKIKKYWLSLDRSRFLFLTQENLERIKRVQTSFEFEKIVEDIWKNLN